MSSDLSPFNATGWILPDDRTSEMHACHAEWKAETPFFGEINGGVGDIPDNFLLYDLEIKATGGLLPRIGQVEGSCVGVSDERSSMQAACGDAVLRGDEEYVTPGFPFPTWGIGRQLGGLRGRGAGSFGGAQAKARKQWGGVAFDDPNIPKPVSTKNGWLFWSSKIELDYSWPPSWPGDREALTAEAANHQYETTTQIGSIDELRSLLSQGYGCTMACDFGTRPKVIDGYLVGDWNLSWAHQQSISGYHTHPNLGLLFAIDNQWGPDAHPPCPLLSKLGVYGSYWIRESVMKKIIQTGEVIGRSASEGFPVRPPDWRLVWA